MSLENTLAERGSRYGDFTDHAELAQELQDVMRGFRKPGPQGQIVNPWAKLDSVKRQALTVIADKIARILSGDPNYTDNWHDIQGYAKLAEDRCIDTTSPQLPFADIGDGVAQDDAFRDAVVYGTGATLGGEHVPVDRMHEHGNVERQRGHLLDRQGDEFFCPRCAKRWAADEPAPPCSTGPDKFGRIPGGAAEFYRNGGYEMGN